MRLIYHPYDPTFVARVRAGGQDAYGRPAEHAISDGDGTPCRSCLKDVPTGAGMLILAARPFPGAQPYAETGPIFLCADPCVPWAGPGIPPVLTSAPTYLIKGYSADDRIVYGTGAIVAAEDLPGEARHRLSDPRVAYVDIRSARNNCFQCRITAEPAVAPVPVPA